MPTPRSGPTRPILLCGFMGTGKSTVGPLLAGALGRRFVDLDAEVTAAAGASVAEIFDREGEAGFRARERAALEHARGYTDAVVALGGGATATPAGLACARAAGPLVLLRASPAEILRRLGDPGGRPLLRGAPDAGAAVRELLAARAPYYEAADLAVDTDGRDAPAVAAELAGRLAELGLLAADPAAPALVPVELGARRYDICIARGFGHLAPRLAAYRGRRCAVLTDANVAAAQLGALSAALDAAGLEATILTVEPGEASKSLSVAEQVIEGLCAAELDRDSLVVCLGGGVVCDLGGFVASIYLRGVPHVMLPTSLLAQVDASVGGKTGVNLAAGKNLIGTFTQPRLCYVNLDALTTLPPPELRAGLAEVVKHALLADADLLAFLEGHAEAIAAGDLEGLARCVRRSCEIKAAIVTRDEREEGERAVLNLGHTVGHAIEACSGYRVRHGEAVALGLLAALRVSGRRGLCDPALEGRVGALLERLGLGGGLALWLRPEVLARVAVDKKRRHGRLRFVAVTGPGAAQLITLTREELAADLLSEAKT
ncbi:MAG TPA: 3-dehydroquinate synthase [Polyangia bacterium]|jgi:shikimate kinase/3-dehydroquinate synthase